MPVNTPKPTSRSLLTRYRNLTRPITENKGLDMVDKFLINAASLGIFALFTLFLLGKKQPKSTVVPAVSPAPKARP